MSAMNRFKQMDTRGGSGENETKIETLHQNAIRYISYHSDHYYHSKFDPARKEILHYFFPK